jgi:hypothetical protein
MDKFRNTIHDLIEDYANGKSQVVMDTIIKLVKSEQEFQFKMGTYEGEKLEMKRQLEKLKI